MDEVKLVHDGAYPKSKDTVKGLRALQKAKYKKLDKKVENIIVLRAMENEAADAEIQMAKSLAGKGNVKNSGSGRGGILLSNTADQAIVIGDSDDEDSGVYSGDDSSDTNHSEVNRAQDHPAQEVTEYRGLGGYTSGSAVGSMKNNEVYTNGQRDSPIEVADDSDDEMDEDTVSETGAHAVYDKDEDMQYSQAVIRTDHGPDDYQLLIDSGELAPATYQRMLEDARRRLSSYEPEHEVTHQHGRMPQQTAVTQYSPTQVQAQPAMPQQPAINPFAPLPLQAQPVELFVLCQQLHPDIAMNFNFSAFYNNCASPHCRRQMILKPWTRYHISTFLPLCTDCTRVYLGPGMTNDPIALQFLEGQVQGEYVEKERRQLSGNAQNPDPDAPFNYAQALTGPINQPVRDNMNALAYIRNAVGPVGQLTDNPMHAAVTKNNEMTVSKSDKLPGSNDIPMLMHASAPDGNKLHASTDLSTPNNIPTSNYTAQTPCTIAANTPSTIAANNPRAPTPPPPSTPLKPAPTTTTTASTPTSPT